MSPNHTTRRKPAAGRRQAEESALDPASTPQALPVTELQRTLGNRATQRALAQMPAPVVGQISRAPASAQRMVQRNVFHSMLRGFARENIFGKNADRRRISESTESVKKKTHFFSDVKDVTVKNGEHNLSGRHYRGLKAGKNIDAKYAGKTVLFLSGSGGSAEQYGLDLAKFYCTRGADVVAVNYRGFGGSTKDSKTLMGKATTTRIDASDITEDGLYSDAHAIFGWLMGEGVSPDNTIIHGYSLGGPVAAELTAHLAGKGIRVGGLVLESPMDSVREQAKQAAPTRGIGAFMADSGGVILDLRQHLRTLAKIDGFQDLAIHFMGGEGSAGDQLGLDVTKVDQDAAKMGFTNISSTTAKGADHMNSKKHAEVAERGANTYDNPAQSIDRLFKTAVPQVQSDAPSSTPSDPKTEQVVDQMMVVLSEDAQKEVVKTTEGGESESESTGG